MRFIKAVHHCVFHGSLCCYLKQGVVTQHTHEAGKIADYLHVEFQEARLRVESHLTPYGTVQSPVGFGRLKYRILDVRRLEKYLTGSEKHRLDECRKMRQSKEDRQNIG